MKSGVSPQIRAVNTNSGVLSLELHSTRSEPVNFFGAQSSVAGGTSSHLGGNSPGMPPRGAGPGFAAQVGVTKNLCLSFFSAMSFLA